MDYISISRSNYTSASDIKAEQIISDIFAEYHLLDYIFINGPNYISVTRAINLNIIVKADRFIRTICPSHINLFINQDIVIKTEWFIETIKVEPCLPHHGNIVYISDAFITSGFSIDIIVKKEKFIRIIFISYINLLYSIDIDIKAERFIKTFHSFYIYLVKSISREAPSGDHQLILKSHRGASLMNTSEEHITYAQDIMVKQEGLDIQTSCTYLTILSVFISKYLIFNESIIDNYFHIILVALHQWEALDITHSCPSRIGVSRSHRISNPYIMDIIHQKSVYISFIDTIIYDTSIYHTSIYDTFGIIMVDGIDLSSMTRKYSIIGFIDFMKHPSEDSDITFNYSILKKKDINIRVDISTRHIFRLITITLDISSIYQFSSIFQSNNSIINYLIQMDIYIIYLPFSYFTDISSQNINKVSIMNYSIDKIITDLVINLQPQCFAYNQLITLLIHQQLSIICHTTSTSVIHHRVDFHLEHIINHIENYITFHFLIYLTFNITFDISYINRFIIEPYNTILETEVIRNVNTEKTSDMDINIHEPCITTDDIDFSVYLIIITVELIDSIREKRTIIVAEDRTNIKIIKEEFEEVSTSCCFFIKTIVLFYVFIFTSKGDSIIVNIERTS